MQFLALLAAGLSLVGVRVPESLQSSCENRALLVKVQGAAATEWNRALHFLETIDLELALRLSDLSWQEEAPERIYLAYQEALLLLKNEQARFSEREYMPNAQGETIGTELEQRLRRVFGGRPHYLAQRSVDDLTRYYRNSIYQAFVFLEFGLREQVARQLLQQAQIVAQEPKTELMLANYLDLINQRPLSSEQAGLALASAELSLDETKAVFNNYHLPSLGEVQGLVAAFAAHRSGTGDAREILAAAGFGRNQQARIFQDWQYVERNSRCCSFQGGCPDCPRQRDFLRPPSTQ